MRMWMVPVKYMCNQHLLGEHVELHMLVGTIRKGKRIDGYARNGLIEPLMITSRHNDIVREMEARGMNHKTPLEISLGEIHDLLPENVRIAHVDQVSSWRDLLGRCDKCRGMLDDI